MTAEGGVDWFGGGRIVVKYGGTEHYNGAAIVISGVVINDVPGGKSSVKRAVKCYSSEVGFLVRGWNESGW